MESGCESVWWVSGMISRRYVKRRRDRLGVEKEYGKYVGSVLKCGEGGGVDWVEKSYFV